ncbi:MULTISPECIES: hypothetical protein [unclassified Aureimonas]|uniref:hypothetical protein n=1 Tax=unclassified Aureimonas TaxID=2615206 RepID=UPI0006FE13C3|nr:MULTISPECIES: hypothetical protein [unclassified Aureimonas]KQT52805.1 hypothetical protein ASG62_12825 [Aureimonas sp. Leaf427]KQT80264.1 hypothetical protein ASG54_06675 [Aureimonas sp. Leaf460]
MATGLATFDAFSWASLLKGRRVLVVDRDGPRGRATLEALEEAGAVATLSPNQAFAADRLVEGPFRHIVLSLSGTEALGGRFTDGLRAAGRGAIVLSDPARHEELRTVLPAARIGDQTMDARSLVLFVIETPDE